MKICRANIKFQPKFWHSNGSSGIRYVITTKTIKKLYDILDEILSAAWPNRRDSFICWERERQRAERLSFAIIGEYQKSLLKCVRLKPNSILKLIRHFFTLDWNHFVTKEFFHHLMKRPTREFIDDKRKGELVNETEYVFVYFKWFSSDEHYSFASVAMAIRQMLFESLEIVSENVKHIISFGELPSKYVVFNISNSNKWNRVFRMNIRACANWNT